MSDLTQRIQSRINDYSDSQKEIAKDKCNEAKIILQKGSEIKKNKDHIDSACELLVEAIQIYPGFTEPYRILAYILAMFDQYEKAVNLLNQALIIEPGNTYSQGMLEEYKEKAIDKDFSEKVSKVASKSLNEKIKSKGFSPFNILEKINSTIEDFIHNNNAKKEDVLEVPNIPDEKVKETSIIEIIIKSDVNDKDFMENLQQIKNNMILKKQNKK